MTESVSLGLGRSQTSAQHLPMCYPNCIGVGVAVTELVSNLPDFHHVHVVLTCRHLNIAGVSILLGLVAKFLILVVINEQLVDVHHHVVGCC